MNWCAYWIKPTKDMKEVAPVFRKNFTVSSRIQSALLTITALGVYEVKINGFRVSDYVLAPGWTAYQKRLQYQQYDVTEYLIDKNCLMVTVGKGWYRSILSGRMLNDLQASPSALLAQLEIIYDDGRVEQIGTDESWEVSESCVRFSEIYDGEIYDGSFLPSFEKHVEYYEGPWDTLIPQEGEKIVEHERLAAARIITTPKGECVVDFGQNIAGYVEISVTAKAGEVVSLSHGETLDCNGNFYNENYVGAKAQYHYTCQDGHQIYHPLFTFYGFRYVRIDEFPGGPEAASADQFTAVAVYSDIRRTGYVNCSESLLNKFFSNVIWSQKSNFLDIPTDCPQRDERLGWTGDAQMFVKAATYNYDVEKFFDKWLGCMRAEQLEDGYIGHMIPDTWRFEGSPAAWADAALICPWEIYLAYGDSLILRKQFQCMKKRIDYITRNTTKKNLWTGCLQYGDWYAPDRADGCDSGPSDKDLIATAYYAYSTGLLVKAGKVLGEDVRAYEKLYCDIVKAFRETYPIYTTQTECAVAVHFRLAEDCQAVSDQLAQMVLEAGTKLTTGFVGITYILHALSDFGHADVAYALLMRKEYPSWLYEISKGATTVWENWSGIMEDGTFWKSNENSLNHYVYGAVIDWVYSVAGGIRQIEEFAGYKRARIAPTPSEKLDWLKVSLDTRQGKISSEWRKEELFWRYEITTPVEAEVIIAGVAHWVQPGTYYYYSERTILQ